MDNRHFMLQFVDSSFTDLVCASEHFEKEVSVRAVFGIAIVCHIQIQFCISDYFVNKVYLYTLAFFSMHIGGICMPTAWFKGSSINVRTFCSMR